MQKRYERMASEKLSSMKRDHTYVKCITNLFFTDVFLQIIFPWKHSQKSSRVNVQTEQIIPNTSYHSSFDCYFN